jgi:cytochrome c553
MSLGVWTQMLEASVQFAAREGAKRMQVRVAILAAVAAFALTATAMADGNADAGATKAAVCSACHGQNGHSINGIWPNLAGQHASYIVEQLKAFKSGQRLNPVMAPMVAALSPEDMEDIAAYYAAQTESGLEADPSYWKAGETLYRGGVRDQSVPACIACHGPIGRGNAPGKFPALRAQHAEYTLKQLRDYASKERKTGPAGIMQTIAGRLTEEEMRNVASYVQGLR